MSFTSSDDKNTLQQSDTANIGAGAGNDIYVVAPSGIGGASKTITITDTEGVNQIWFKAPITIESSSFENDFAELTLSTGGTIKIFGASTFTFTLGFDPDLDPNASTVPNTGNNRTFEEFAADMGASVPVAGASAVSGSADTIVNANGTTSNGSSSSGSEFSITSATPSVLEGNSGTTAMEVTVTRTGDDTIAASVDIAIAGVDATAGTDFTAPATQIVDFAAGETSKIITIDITGDTEAEGDETLTVSLNTPSTNSTINATANTVTLTIENDEPAVVNLTQGVDVKTANVFNAGRVSDGDDDTNSLNDDDVLTGEGSTAATPVTLNFTYVDDDTRSPDYDIAPTLNGIEVINLRSDGNFTLGGGTATLDLQDGSASLNELNITRVDATTLVDNITSTQATLSLSNSSQVSNSVGYLYTDAALSGTADTTTLTLSNVNVNNLFVEENGTDGTINQGYETIDLVSSGAANRIDGRLAAEDLATLTITGDQNLRIDSVAEAGSLSSVNAANMTGTAALDFNIDAGVMGSNVDGTSGTDMAFSLVSTANDDTIRISDTVTTNDTIDTGAGNDIMRMSSAENAVGAPVNFLADNATAQVSNLEAIRVTLNNDADAVGEAEMLRVDMDQMSGDQTSTLENLSGDDAATFALLNATAAEATGMTILHSSTGANALASNTVLLDVEGGVTSAAIAINEGVNADPRFNFSLTADSNAAVNATTAAVTGTGDTTNTVVNVTLNDNDSESNTVNLTEFARHTGTITLNGGTAGTFLNLDATANAQMRDQSGAATDGAGFAEPGVGAVERIVAATVDAASFVGDAIVRVSTNAASATGAQNITMGSGNDMVIFDQLTDTRAGLSNADTVAGGAGNDTLAIDGDTTVAGNNINLSITEFAGVTGFETLQFMGNGAQTYSVALSDSFVNANATAGILNVINDNDTANDTGSAAGTPDTAGTGVESALTLDAQGLTGNNGFNYNGEEGASRTNDRFIMSDDSMDDKTTIDGGAVDNDTDNNTAANADILEVRNSAHVASGDLVNVKNVGTISITNDAAVNQVTTVQLTDTIVDAMVDSYQASNNTTHIETLTLNAMDNVNSVTGLLTSATGLNLQASTLTDKSALNITAARGGNDIATGASDDSLVILGNYATGAYVVDENGVDIDAQATNQVGLFNNTDTINLGAGTDTLTTYGDLNLVGATLTGIENLVIHSDVRLTESQYNSFANITADGNGAHTLTIFDDSNGVATDIDVSKVRLDNGATLEITTGGANDVTTTGDTNDTNVTGTPIADVTLNGVAAPTYTLDGSAATTMNEDAANVTYTVTTTNVADGDLAYTLSGRGIEAADITGGSLTGNVAIVNGTGTITLSAVADAATEGDETLVVTLDDDNTATVNTTIVDTSLDAAAGTAIQLSANNGQTLTATDGVVDIFVLDFDSAAGTAVAGTQTIVTIDNFNIGEDILRVDDTVDPATTQAAFLAASTIAVDPFAGSTSVSLLEPAAGAGGSVVTLTGIQDATLGGAAPYFEMV